MELSQALITGKGITLAEALSTGGKVTVLGLAIVFAVLIVLMLILMLFKVIFYKNPQKQTKEVSIETEQSENSQFNEEELIAVLTAAVAASLNTSTYNLHIKSYRRIEDKKPVWNKAGLRETINNRF